MQAKERLKSEAKRVCRHRSGPRTASAMNTRGRPNLPQGPISAQNSLEREWAAWGVGEWAFKEADSRRLSRPFNASPLKNLGPRRKEQSFEDNDKPLPPVLPKTPYQASCSQGANVLLLWKKST